MSIGQDVVIESLSIGWERTTCWMKGRVGSETVLVSVQPSYNNELSYR